MRKAIFGDLIYENGKWNASGTVGRDKFTNYVRRVDWEPWRDDFEHDLSDLESDVDGKIEDLKKNGTLDYVGAVELQSKVVELYKALELAKGFILCYEPGDEIDNMAPTSDDVDITNPQHGHPETKAETTTYPFSEMHGGGDLVGIFTRGMKDMMSETNNPLLRSQIFQMVNVDDVNGPLSGKNALDWRTPTTTHNNIPPVQNILIRYVKQSPNKDVMLVRDVDGNFDKMKYESMTVLDMDEFHEDDFTEHDYVLRIVDASQSMDLRKQSLRMLLDIFSESTVKGVGWQGGRFIELEELLKPKLDDALVLKSELLTKYAEWDARMSTVWSKFQEILELIKSVKPPVYVGRVIVSMTDDTEQKVVKNYGGKRWRRLVNFVRGVEKIDGNNVDLNLGKKFGEEYVELRESNVFAHTHDVKLQDKSTTSNGAWLEKDKPSGSMKTINSTGSEGESI